MKFLQTILIRANGDSDVGDKVLFVTNVSNWLPNLNVVTVRM